MKEENKKESLKDTYNGKLAQEEVEDATEYGEFIPSFYKWNTLDSQKQIAEKLQNITKNKK